LAYRAGAAVLDEAAIPDVETARESRSAVRLSCELAAPTRCSSIVYDLNSFNFSFFQRGSIYGIGRSPGFPENQEVGLSRMFSKFLKDESAATAIEYGLIAAGIALAIIAAVNGLGTTLNDKFTSINTSLK
jgi:pilus assembly protein Flp/PilA